MDATSAAGQGTLFFQGLLKCISGKFLDLQQQLQGLHSRYLGMMEPLMGSAAVIMTLKVVQVQ